MVFGSFPEQEKLPGCTVKYMQLCHKTTDLALLWNSVQKGGLDRNSTGKVVVELGMLPAAIKTHLKYTVREGKYFTDIVSVKN